MTESFEQFDRQSFIAFTEGKDSPFRGRIGGLFSLFYLSGGLTLGATIKNFDPKSGNLWILGGWMILAICFMLGFPRIWVKIFSKQERNQFLKCPACGKSMTSKNRPVTIATGQCVYCGEKILCD